MKSQPPDLAELRRASPWFQGSAASDATGRPLVLYHGTSAAFDRFAPSESGIWLAEDPLQADPFSRIRPGTPRILALHASIRRPWVLIRYGQDFPFSKMLDQSIPTLKALGYDGLYRPEDRVWVAFWPEQLRSALAPEPDELQNAQSSAEAGYRDGEEAEGATHAPRARMSA